MGKKVKKDAEPPASDVFDTVNIESKNAKTAVLMLDSPEPEVILKACESLYRFGEKCEENRLQVMQFGALEPLFGLVKSEDKGIHRNAIMAFGILACHAEVRKVMRNMDCTKVIMKLLDAEQEESITTEFASLFFANMAIEYTNKVSLIEKGVVEPLVLLLSAPDPDVQKNSIDAINLLLHDYTSRALVRQFEGIAPIVELTKSEYPVIQQVALEALAKVTQDIENRDALRELDGLDHFIKFLSKTEWSDQHVNALLVLSNLLQDPETVEQLAETNGLEKFYEILTGEETTAEVKVHACIAISRSAKNEDNRKVMHEQEMEKTLITLLTEGDDVQVKAAAAKALSQLAESLTCKNFIGRNEGIPPLISQIKSNNDELRESASLCLANLTLGNHYNCNEVYERNGMDPIINLLGDSREACQANGATLLTNLASDEVIRNSLQSLVIVGALSTPIQSKSNIVQSRAAMCLASVCYDADARRELRECGAIEHLVELLGSGNDEVRRNACLAVATAAADAETVAEMSRAGVMEHLHEINQSSVRRSNYSELAMERVLDNHLPAKYAYIGHLTVNNMIGDMFYDPGGMKSTEKLKNVEELCQEPVNEKREILLINAHQTDYKDTGSEISTEEGQAHTKKKSVPNMKATSVAARERARNIKKDKDKKLDESTNEDDEENEKKMFIAPEDHNLEAMIKQVRAEVMSLNTMREQVAALGKFVAEQMGGEVSREELMNFSFKLALSKLKTELNSNVIPIGLIKQGTFYHRALLFKTLADRICLPVTLDRGQFGRAWNTITLDDPEVPPPGAPRYPPKKYLIDVMHEAGSIHEIESQKSIAYQRL